VLTIHKNVHCIASKRAS